jgi:hypothetical protein
MIPQRHPLNAPGDFYVLNDMCIACEAPECEAPDLVGHCGDRGTYHCYFKRQPKTTAEISDAISAVVVSCCRAVRYGGDDHSIIARVAELNRADSCDHRS